MASWLALLVFSLVLAKSARSRVPPSEQFRMVHGGDFIEYRPIEYGADIQDYKPYNDLFQLSIYNATPDAFTLALRMGEPRQMSTLRWVWEANRGNPVRLNATLTFGADGNLVLANADGRVAWHTNTANKGVVGIKVKDNGNLVLHDSKGYPIWQSFDSPTDTLMVGQSLKSGGRTRLVSRKSDEVAEDGPYSLVMEPKRLAMYYTSPNTKKPILYYAHDFGKDIVGSGNLESLTFGANVDPEEGGTTYLDLRGKVNGSEYDVFKYFVRPKYNSTLSFLRLSPDGNLRIYTYNTKVDTQAWEVTYNLFYKEDEYTSFSRSMDMDATVCQLPEHCGQFGLCKNSQCVACPTENGLTGWDETCRPPKLTGCDPKRVRYYKLDGVDHFMTKYTRGSDLKEDECGNKCTKDCKCLGYFYNRKNVKCWLAYELGTLTKVDDGSRVGYIKAQNGNGSARIGRI